MTDEAMTLAHDAAPDAVQGRAAAAPDDSSDPTTWSALLHRNARSSPDAPALIDGERSVSNAVLLDRVRRLAAGFADRGIGRGDVVAVWLPNCIEWVETAAALASLGATALGINTKLRSFDVRRLLERAECDTVVSSPAFKGIDFLGMLQEIHASDPDAVRLVVEAADPSAAAPTGAPDATDPAQAAQLPFATVDYDNLLTSPPRDQGPDDPDSLASAFTSSGSTGVPKIIMHSQAGIIGHSTAVGRRFGYTDDDVVVLVGLPLCGVFGLNSLMAALTAQRTAVLQAVFEPQATVDLIERHRVTHTNMSDAMLDMTLHAAGDPDRIASLREVGFGNFTATDVRELLDRGAHLRKRFFQTYGSSEVQALMCYPRDDADLGRLSLGGGVPVTPLTQVRITPTDGGEEASDGSDHRVGEIEVRGPFISPARITGDGHEPTPVTADGWFATGDLGYMDSADDVVYLSRMGDVLRLGGFLVSPREVEEFLITLPGIAQAQFVAAQMDEGLVPVAFVVRTADSPTHDEDAILTACRSTLARFKVPQRVIPLDEFPTIRGANGDKIQRNRLREMAEAALASSTTQSTNEGHR